MTDATRHLTPPEAPSDIPPVMFTNIGSLFDYVSPTAWINELIKQFTDWDAMGECAEIFSGDWQAFGRYCDLLGKLSKSLGDISDDVQRAAWNMDPSWNGHAADAAHMYFTQTAVSLKEHQEFLTKVAKEYHETAFGTWMLAEQLKSILQMIIDNVLYAIICSSVGTALIETGFGAVAGYAGATYFIIQAMRLITKFTNLVQVAIMSLWGTPSGLFQVTNEYSSIGSIPKVGSYTHPALGATS